MKSNKCIGCVVRECKFHSKDQDFCSLEHIDVVKYQNQAFSEQSTGCGTFQPE